MKPIDLIYARDINYGIGVVDGDKYNLPWNIGTDIKYFNNITTETSKGIPNENLMNAVIMGKNTWSSIDQKFKPLNNRVNIIVSSTLDQNSIDNYNNTYIVTTLTDAINLANVIPKIETIFIIGGAQLYNESFKYINFRYLYETIIYKNYNCNIKINNYGSKYIFSKKRFLLKNTIDDHSEHVEFCKSINISYCNTNNIQISSLIPQCKNPEEQNYLDIMSGLINDGDFRTTRNGNTWSLFNNSINFNLNNQFPLITTKKVNFKAVVEELLWFLRGDTNAKHLDEKGVKIWNLNTNRDFLDNNGLKHYEEFDTGPMYGFNLNHFGCEYKGMNENYENKGFNQLNYVLNLIKNDPTSRRIVMTTFNPAQANEGVLYPCHGLTIQFYVTKDGKLDVVTYQR